MVFRLKVIGEFLPNGKSKWRMSVRMAEQDLSKTLPLQKQRDSTKTVRTNFSPNSVNESKSNSNPVNIYLGKLLNPSKNSRLHGIKNNPALLRYNSCIIIFKV